MDRIRVELDPRTAEKLRAVAAAERRPTADQAAVIIERALARRDQRRRQQCEADAGPGSIIE
jgi:hypothetical protein